MDELAAARSETLDRAGVRTRRFTFGARLLAAPIYAYRALGAGRPSPCRFDPSCSTYALAALHRHGALLGSWLTVRRLARCHPWGGHGWDPVPTARAWFRNPERVPTVSGRRAPLSPTNRKVFDV